MTVTEPNQDVRTRLLDNGLVLLLQPMPAVQSAALSLMVPAGSVYEAPGRNGTASMLCDLLTRGAGDQDNREFTTALDDLGVQRHESVGIEHLVFSAATISHNLSDTLRLYADLALRPRLPEEEIEPVRLGVAQSLQAIEDEPRQKVMLELRRRCWESPWGLPSDGQLEHLPEIGLDDLRELYENGFRPNGSILGIAGRFDPDRVTALVEALFGRWEGGRVPTIETSPPGPPVDHLPHESTQTQIGIAYPGIPYRDPDYYAAWASVSILSGGSSSRLWDEVREKRGLVYSVYATLTSLKDRGEVLCYAGTTTERAQETIDVIFAELERLGEGIAEDELERCKARAKTALVMQQESTIARAGAIARDWHHLGRIKPLEEVRAAVDELTTETVLEYVHAHPPSEFKVVTIGTEAPRVPVANDPADADEVNEEA